LGSTNGTWLAGRQLQAQQPVEWPPNSPLQIGALTLQLTPTSDVSTPDLTSEPLGTVAKDDQPESLPDSETFKYEALPQTAFTIVCPDANPRVTVLGPQPVLIGSGASCAIRLNGPSIANHHVIAKLVDGKVDVTNVDATLPAYLGDKTLEIGQPAFWESPDQLRIGNSILHLSQDMAAESPSTANAQLKEASSNSWRYLALIAGGGLALLCLISLVFTATRGINCDGLDFDCIFSGGNAGQAGGLAILTGNATPTLAPVVTSAPLSTSVPTVEFSVDGPTPTAVPVDCAPEGSSQAGWLDLPFPYQGTLDFFGGSAEDFRRISQRSKFGGRINSFFDHEFPVYPPMFGGREPDNLDNTLVIFNGERSEDAYSQDTEDSDWYSGHSGIDYAPANPREATTPILAAAEGRLLLAKIDKDDNHMVWLEHDPDGDGVYEYATLYFHLHPDAFFFNMTEMEERAPIAAGQRIGTMGTTGRSSGIHLHFEVRHDVDRDGRFSIFERVDPYGWFPGQEIVDDPWAILVSWIDSKGDLYEHKGIESQYLWKHPLVDVVDSSGECQQVTNVKVDLYNVLGWAVVDPGFTYIARNEQGEILEVGQPHRRTITLLEEDLDGVDPSTISLEWLDPRLDTWFTYERAELEPNSIGGYTFSAIVDKTGRYVLVAKEVVDRVPPVTTIRLSGESTGENNTYRDSVVVTLAPMDRGLIQSDISETQYSLDCGQSWTTYTEPFNVTLSTDHTCGDVTASSETIELSQNDFLLLAISEDSEKNIEQPPAQIRFRIE
jgi:murein DD-endopeptidase MepM/ murein hydrolase activator NlpD